MSTTLESVSQKDYHFIIVGGGTAGVVLAARLTENPDLSVLLVEAGNKEAPIDHTIVPLLAPQASAHPEFTWQYGLVAQKALNDRPIPYPSGKAIGGTSWVNFMFALRGPSSDWDRIAEVTGDNSWCWENILPYAKKLETFVPPTGGWDCTTEYDASTDGTSGPVRVSIANSPSPGSKLVVETAKKESLFNKSVNSGEMLGIGWLPGTIGGGIRNSSANYLAQPKSNLDILTGAQVTKVLFSEGDEPTAVGIEYASGPGAKRFKTKAKNEVILSAGSIGSPQILMLSGIGDAEELESHGVTVMKDLRDVGKNLQDHHLLFGNHFLVDSKDTFDTILQDQSAAQASQRQFDTNFSGLLSNMVAQAVGFWRVEDDAPIWSETQDSSSGPTAPHYEILFGDGYVDALPPPSSGNYFSAVSVGLTPNSRGSITLNSSDPFTFPNINPNLLGTKHDVYIAVQAVKKAREYLSKPQFKDYVIEEYGPIAQLHSDEEIEAYVRAASISCWHPTSTASMSAKGSRNGVVNPDLTVKGVKNLRVVDASVLPYVPAAHPQLPVYIVAEKAADSITRQYTA